jgi:hypothetical protein
MKTLSEVALSRLPDEILTLIGKCESLRDTGCDHAVSMMTQECINVLFNVHSSLLRKCSDRRFQIACKPAELLDRDLPL